MDDKQRKTINDAIDDIAAKYLGAVSDGEKVHQKLDRKTESGLRDVATAVSQTKYGFTENDNQDIGIKIAQVCGGDQVKMASVLKTLNDTAGKNLAYDDNLPKLKAPRNG